MRALNRSQLRLMLTHTVRRCQQWVLRKKRSDGTDSASTMHTEDRARSALAVKNCPTQTAPPRGSTVDSENFASAVRRHQERRALAVALPNRLATWGFAGNAPIQPNDCTFTLASGGGLGTSYFLLDELRQLAVIWKAAEAAAGPTALEKM